MINYQEFLARKAQLARPTGFAAEWLPDQMYPFQSVLAEWSMQIGRGLLLADCGLGKSLIELTWARNVVIRTGRPVLILTPLMVGPQFLVEGEKFGIECIRSRDGAVRGEIVVANYESLHKFDPSRFAGVVCDESGCIKNFSGKRRHQIVEFLRTIQYRLLATATAAPNDYHELGNSAEALGHLGYMDMLSHFFTNDEKSINPNALGVRWRFKKAAEGPFWRWVCSWSRSCRRPSDLGFDDDGFILPELRVREHVLDQVADIPGVLPGIVVEARNMYEEREERRANLRALCERAASLVDHHQPAVIWTDSNAEADLLETMIGDALQVSGSMPDELKEERFQAFQSGELRVMITKPKIGAWGLNWQHCAHVVTFVSHSFEQYYQKIRRCWRYGQERPVDVDIVMTPGERRVARNLERKAAQAEEMHASLIRMMNDALAIDRSQEHDQKVMVPSWLM